MKSVRHPIRAIREPFGKAGFTVAILALVLAMAGGAWAATGLNSKQKKEVKAIAKSFQGTGPTGPAGAAGPAGTNGTNGKDGTNAIAGPPTGAAGGALSGTYPNPTLAASSVATSNFATGATAPNAALFGGLLPSEWQKRVNGTCAAGQAIREIAAVGTVVCQTAGSGTVTSVASGTGLTGGPITSSGSLAVDPTVVQSRVTGACLSGQAVKSIAQNGTVTCEPINGGGGDISEVTVSGGLTGGGASGAVNVGVDATQIQSRVSGTCTSGQAVKSIAQNGTVTCEPTGGTPKLPTTLGSGESEVGTWAVSSTIEGETFTSVSFTIPLATALSGTVQSNEEGFPAGATVTEKEHCPGSVSDPKAKAGWFCTYVGFEENVQFDRPPEIYDSAFNFNKTDKSGAVLDTGGGFQSGTWAVTAP